MITLSLSEIAAATSGRLVGIEGAQSTTAYPIIDSRLAAAETFFIALPGERVDGNDYASQAIAAGSQFAIVNQDLGIPSVVVGDVPQALKDLAAFVRGKMAKTTFIAITGSQGKTTVKDLAGQVLNHAGNTVIPQGSLNNEIGVPLTILRCSDETRFCVLEMGARHIGDIATLMEIAHPTIGAMLVVGNAHVGEFGSSENIALAKSEIIQGLKPGSSAILGTYDSFTPKTSVPTGVKRIAFGETSDCDVRAADIELRGGYAHFDLVSAGGRAPVTLKVLGAHQIANALAAAAIGIEAGMSVEAVAAALSEAEILSKWRMELHRVGELTLINDSYNANPESTSAALKTLVALAQESGGRSWAFLGKMHELGELEQVGHQSIGTLASELGVDYLVSVGTDLYLRGGQSLSAGGASAMTTHFVLTQEDALALASHLEAGDVVLVKASRAEHLDELAEKLLGAMFAREQESSQEGEVE